MTSPILTEAASVDGEALGAAIEAADHTVGPYYQHLALPSAAALPTHLDPPKKKPNAPPATETKSGRSKAISPKLQRTLATSHWSLPRSGSFEWQLISVRTLLSRDWRTLKAAPAILNITRGQMQKSLEIETFVFPRM